MTDYRCADCGRVLESNHQCPEPHTPFTGNADIEYHPHEVGKE